MKATRALSAPEPKLLIYAKACQALAAALTTDEVKKIRNGAAMLRAYAKQAENKQLEMDAIEIRIRAERRVGELMAAQKQTVGLAKGGRPEKSTGGKKPPVKNALPTLAEAGIDKDLAKRARNLAQVPGPKFEKLVTAWRDRTEQDGERVTADLLRPAKHNVHHSSETAEHYTPKEILDIVIACLGKIDLDPCSNPGKPNVPATRHFTEAEDGLTQPWAGQVYMNPPYGREIGKWTEKARDEFQRGNVTEFIGLLPARTDTAWFDALTKETDAAVVCFLYGRISFIGNSDPAPFPSMVIYFGPRHDHFARTFAGAGSLWQRPGSPLEWFVNHR